MLRILDDLPPNAAAFVAYCLESYNLKDLVDTMCEGINTRHCEEFSISEEQWQDAVYVAMKEMSKDADSLL